MCKSVAKLSNIILPLITSDRSYAQIPHYTDEETEVPKSDMTG